MHIYGVFESFFKFENLMSQFYNRMEKSNVEIQKWWIRNNMKVSKWWQNAIFLLELSP